MRRIALYTASAGSQSIGRACQSLGKQAPRAHTVARRPGRWGPGCFDRHHPAGASAFVLGKLNTLQITVYVPEDTYGRVKLGQTAKMTVDSYPGVSFTALVVHIADQAEFTPRNVQTAEGRRTTVYAIKLDVPNPDGKLKPGMPADVTFE